MKSIFNFWKKNEITHPDALSSDVIKAYNSSRSIKQKKHICHAPFNNMYFNTEGHIAVCWLTFNNPVVYTEKKTLREIWQDAKLNSLRQNVKENNLQAGCGTCEKHLKEGNFVNVLARAYDNDYALTDYPSIMEFELENVCNLACTMCNGMLSSSIRKDREKLPPLVSPYGEKFIEELKEFIPHLKEARFNGGEPFLIKTYFKIWDLILAINPAVKITIATNGSVLNARVKDYLKRGNFHLNISMDGFSKEIYESIRINGNHAKLHENFEWFRDYCNENDRTLCIMINPMRQNWWEMIDFLNWCNKHSVHLWFNSIIRPEDQAIWNLSASELQNIYTTLHKAEILPNINTSKNIYDYNVKTYRNLVEQQIKTWWEEAISRENEEGPRINTRETFHSKVNASDSLSSSDKERLLSSIDALAKKLDNSKTPLDTFYTSIGKTDLSKLLKYTEEKSTSELISLFESHSNNSH